DVEHHIQIARRRSAGPDVALSRITDSRSVFHARRNRDIHGALVDHTGFAFALLARIGNHAARSLTCRTGARDREETLLVAYLAPAMATRTGHRPFARGRARAPALLADFVALDLHLGLFAERGLFEGESQIGARVASALRTTAASHVDA